MSASADEASAFTKREVDGKPVRFTVGREARDRYGRLLVYVWRADGQSLNARLLAGGYARTLTIPPNDSYAARFARLAGDARARDAGLGAAASVNPMVNDPFRALSHPIRRGIVERLAAGSATWGTRRRGRRSKPAITKHLRVLEETGVIVRRVEGRTHRLSLDTGAMAEAADWMDRQRSHWERLFDVVDEYLKEDAP